MPTPDATPYWRLSGFYLVYFASLGALIPFWGLYLQDLGHDAAAWAFEPDGGRFDVSVDDQALTLQSDAFPPPAWSPHLGAFYVGGGLVVDTWVTDIVVSQP